MDAPTSALVIQAGEPLAPGVFARVGSAVAAAAVRFEHSPADAAVGRRAMGGDQGAALRVFPRLASAGTKCRGQTWLALGLRGFASVERGRASRGRRGSWSIPRATAGVGQDSREHPRRAGWHGRDGWVTGGRTGRGRVASAGGRGNEHRGKIPRGLQCAGLRALGLLGFSARSPVERRHVRQACSCRRLLLPATPRVVPGGSWLGLPASTCSPS